MRTQTLWISCGLLAPWLLFFECNCFCLAIMFSLLMKHLLRGYGNQIYEVCLLVYANV